MNFDVKWKPDAEDELAQIWVSTSDQSAVTRAANEIERILGRDPLGVGESRDGNARVYFHPPLVVDYRVSQSRRRVAIYSVRILGSL